MIFRNREKNLLISEGIWTFMLGIQTTDCDSKICISNSRFESVYFKRDLILIYALFLVWHMSEDTILQWKDLWELKWEISRTWKKWAEPLKYIFRKTSLCALFEAKLYDYKLGQNSKLWKIYVCILLFIVFLSRQVTFFP